MWCKIMDNFHYTKSAILEAIHLLPRINTSAVVKKGNRTQRKKKVSPWCTHCSYCGWRKGTSWAKAMSNGEKNGPVVLATIELCWSELVSLCCKKFLKLLGESIWVNLIWRLGFTLSTYRWVGEMRLVFGGYSVMATPTPAWSLLYSTIVVQGHRW